MSSNISFNKQNCCKSDLKEPLWIFLFILSLLVIVLIVVFFVYVRCTRNSPSNNRIKGVLSIPGPGLQKSSTNISYKTKLTI